jgi:hypothetical protein
VWAFDRFGAIVAAVRMGDGPLVLLADHRPPGECRLLYAVDDIGEAVVLARAAGATHVMEVGVPPGPCVVFDDADGNPVGVIEETRPERMPEAFRNPENSAALRPPWPDAAS